MKMRNGYVSNSSSSSFLVVYDNLEDFAPFRLFEKGYNRFMEDVVKSTSDEVIGYIKMLLDDYFYHLKEIYERELFNNGKDYDERFEFSYNNQFNTFMCNFNIPLPKTIDKYEKSLEAAADESQEALEQAYEKITDKELTTAAKIIYECLQAKHKTAFIEYEDHTDIGSYMEHDFMPFMRHNPDNKFSVFIQNNH